jgi:hypothetical protein
VRLESALTNHSRVVGDCPHLFGDAVVGFTLCHVDVAERVDFAHIFAALVHHLIEDFRLHLHLLLILNFGGIDAKLEGFVLVVERIHRTVFDASDAAAQSTAERAAEETGTYSFEHGK